MINNERFIEILHKYDIDFFTGVPDSYLNGFCNCLNQIIPEENNIIAANEGNAIGIASGYYFSTGKVPFVYMQNSGMGNAINPILSLADSNVYSIPMILLIGWRGEPGTNDHPQHKMQGELTRKFLEIMKIPYIVAEDNDGIFVAQLADLIEKAKSNRKIVAIIARKGVFDDEQKSIKPVENGYPLFREEAIEILLDIFPKNTIFLATTGRATRELFFLREKRGETHNFDFLNIGSMGHASSVALSLALKNRTRKIVCLDGDSAALMHMGSFSMVSKYWLPNFFHIVLNNGAHESVGGQDSAGMKINFTEIAHGSGYQTVDTFVSTKADIVVAIDILISKSNQASFLDIRIKKGLNRKLPPLNISSYTEIINDFIDTNLKEGAGAL